MIPIFVINLDRSPDRWVAMSDNFQHDELVRFEAIDGGVYVGTEKEITQLLEPEIGCAKSHIAVWQHIVDNEISFALVLEDDVEPVDKTGSILVSMFDRIDNDRLDFDVIFLQENHKRSCESDHDGNYLFGWGAHAYAITLEGAKKSIESMSNMLLPVDMQWMLAFKDSCIFSTWCKPEKNILAKVLSSGIIKHSPLAAKTTFTSDGEKPWTDDRYKGVI